MGRHALADVSGSVFRVWSQNVAIIRKYRHWASETPTAICLFWPPKLQFHRENDCVHFGSKGMVCGLKSKVLLGVVHNSRKVRATQSFLGVAN